MNIGDTINYAWSSTGATSVASTFTEDSSSCGLSGVGPFAWTSGFGDSLYGSKSAAPGAAACHAGHTYVVTYTAKNTSGQGATSSVTVRVRASTSLLPGSTNMANILGAVQTTPAAPQTRNVPTQTPFIRALDKKASGADVVALQNILRAQGFLKAPSTGYYGPATEQAVRRYQTKHGIIATGAVGTQTLAQLVRDEK